MDSIKRIQEMEKTLDVCAPIIEKLLDAIEDFKEAQPYFDLLEQYYSSPEWRENYEADENGRLPRDLKRGVLAQDALFDLLEQRDELLGIINSADNRDKTT